jgi:hypothetical protein
MTRLGQVTVSHHVSFDTGIVYSEFVPIVPPLPRVRELKPLNVVVPRVTSVTLPAVKV